jgi:hypothetical protein
VNKIFAAAILLVAAPILIPMAVGQSTVTGCETQCSPQDPDVNDPPVRSNGTVNVVLYAHMQMSWGIGQLNVFAPDPDHEQDSTSPFFLPTVSCEAFVSCGYGSQGIQMEFCPGGIEFYANFWRLQCHDGTTGVPLHLGADPIVFYAYVSAKFGPDVLPSPVRVGVVPVLDLAAVIRDEVAGRPIGGALASSEPGSARLNVVSLPTDVAVFEVPIELVPAVDEWPPQTSSMKRMLRISLQQVDEAGVKASQADWRFHIGHQFAPRLILPVESPVALETEFLLRNKSLYVRALANSPFGAYDVDGNSFRIEQVGGEPLPMPTLVSLDLVEGNEHDFRGAPAEIIWRYDLSGARGGEYRFNVSVQNQQATFVAVASEDYTVPAFEGRAIPVPALPVLVVLLGAGVAWTRRRANP